jgi:DNA repair protein RadA/Sms
VEVSVEDVPRLSTGIAELDRVLGGGIVPGSLVLLGGDPGVGKSTLLTQVADLLSHERVVLYVSGEESAHQIKLRAKRLGVMGANLYVLAETSLEAILAHIDRLQPVLVVVDSVQTTQTSQMESAPGTVAQVRACGVALQRAAKEQGVAVFLVGHVTKEGALAGPKALEHLVDTVLTFEGDPHLNYRILRATKNRFGSTDEIALFEMREQGLVAVQNPSEWLLSERATHSPGSVVTAIMEGTRPLLVEIQALVTRSYLSQPRRQVTGLDYHRVNMVLAVLEKRAGMRLSDKDVFVNAAGGMYVREPAADLAVALAVVSSLKDKPLPPDMVVFGEVGLAGEVRSVIHTEQRVREAARLGFSRVLLARRDAKLLRARGMEITLDGTYTVRDAVGVVEG